MRLYSFNESVPKQEIPIVEAGLFIQIILDYLKFLILILFRHTFTITVYEWQTSEQVHP